MTLAGYSRVMAHNVSVTPEEKASSSSAFGQFFRNSDTGEWAIVQFPNVPLAIFLVATLVRDVFHPQGAAGTALSVVGAISLIWWSVDEIARGDSPFRRVLGAVVLVGSLLGLLMR
jgi:hypothetical protein